MSELAKVLPDIIRLTEEAARANSEASQRLRQVLEELEPSLHGYVPASRIQPGDEVEFDWLGWRTVTASGACVRLTSGSCWQLTVAGVEDAIHVECSDEFRVRRSCPSVCDGDTHRYPCPIADEIATAMEWERGA